MLCFVVLACSIQDIAILFNIIVIFLLFFNTFVFQAGLVSLLFHKFKGTIVLTAVYFALSIALHVWVMVSGAVSLGVFTGPGRALLGRHRSRTSLRTLIGKVE